MSRSPLLTRSLAGVALLAAALVLSGCNVLNTLTGDVTRDDEGNVTEGNDNADVFAIKVGDCLRDDNIGSGGVMSVPIVPCEEPHESEAFYSHLLPDGAYPGETSLNAEAQTVCTGAQYETFVGRDWNDSVLLVSWYSPTDGSWAAGDREILCLISDPEGQSTGSLQGSDR